MAESRIYTQPLISRNGMSKGTIVLVPFPFTDLARQKVRPALVLHTSRGEDCILAFISSGVSKKKYPFNVPVKASGKNGLKVASVVRVDTLATLQKKIIIGELGTCEPTIMKAVDQTMRRLFAL